VADRGTSRTATFQTQLLVRFPRTTPDPLRHHGVTNRFGVGEKQIHINRIIILPVVLYGCETWSLTLKEERRLKVYENRVLRRIFGRKRDEVTGEWRKLHNEELNDLYSSKILFR
jgi:hypothetical protein